MRALGVFVPLCDGEGCRGERQRGEENNINMFLLDKARRERQHLSKKRCSRSEHSRVVEDVGRTELSLQKSREKTEGDHGVLKTLGTQAAFLVCSRSLFSFMQKHRCRFYQDFGLEHPQLWITDASCHV